MQDIARALLLPPPGWTSGRSGTRGHNEDRDSPAAAQARIPTAYNAFDDGGAEDEIRLRAKAFRFKVYSDRGGLAEDRSAARAPLPEVQEREQTKPDTSFDLLDSLGEGNAGRNSATFVASLIAQTRQSEGLHNPPFAAASGAYRRAGGDPPITKSSAKALNIAI